MLALEVDDHDLPASSSASTAPVGVTATSSPARADTLPAVPSTSPSDGQAARRGGDRLALGVERLLVTAPTLT